MASVAPPAPSYRPVLPTGMIDGGLVSDAKKSSDQPSPISLGGILLGRVGVLTPVGVPLALGRGHAQSVKPAERASLKNILTVSSEY